MDFLNAFVIYLFSLTFVYSAPTKLCGFPPTVVIESNPLYTEPCKTAGAAHDSPLKNICDRIRNESDCYFPNENEIGFPVDDVATSIYDKKAGTDESSKLNENCRYMIDKRLLTVGDKCADICGRYNFYVCDLYVAMDKVLRHYFEQEVSKDYKRLDVFIHPGTYSFLFPFPLKGSLHIPTQLRACSDDGITEESTTGTVCKMIGMVAVEMVKVGNSFSKHRDDPIQYLRIVHGEWDPCENISMLAESTLPKGVQTLKDTEKCHQTCDGDNINICKILFLGLQSLVEETVNGSAGGSLSGSGTVLDSTHVETTETEKGPVGDVADNISPDDSEAGDAELKPGDDEAHVNQPDLNTEVKTDTDDKNKEMDSPDKLPESNTENNSPNIESVTKGNMIGASNTNGQDGTETELVGNDKPSEGEDNGSLPGTFSEPKTVDSKLDAAETPQDPGVVDTSDNKDKDLTDTGGEDAESTNKGDNVPVGDADKALNQPDVIDIDNTEDANNENGTPNVASETTENKDDDKTDTDNDVGTKEETHNEAIPDKDTGSNQPENNEPSEALQEGKGPESTPNTTSSTMSTASTELWSSDEDNVADKNDGVIDLDDVDESQLKPAQTSNEKDSSIEETVEKPKEVYKQSETLSGDSYEDEEVEGGHFMAYFLVFIVVCVAGYIVFHNKQKIIALVIEGKGPNGSGRRPSSKEYKRLKTEDVMPSLEKSAYSKNYVF